MSTYQIIYLALYLTLTIGGIVAGCIKFGLRSELNRHEHKSQAADALLKQRQDSLCNRVDDAHRRIDALEQALKEGVRRDDYIAAMVIVNSKLDSINAAIARLDERTK